MPGKKTTSDWSWYSLRKKHIFKHESQLDNHLLVLISAKLKKLQFYISSSIKDFSGAFQKSSKGLWQVLSIALALLATFHFNSSKINEASFDNFIQQYQIVAIFIGFFILYKLKTIVNFIKITTGPDLRWMRVFLSLGLITLLLSCYSLVPSIPHITVSLLDRVAAVGAMGTALVGAVGSLRQWQFIRKQNQLSPSTQLLVDRAAAKNFRINGQSGPADRLRNIIEKERDSLIPITLLIDGKWGDGKTYLVNQVLKDVEQSTSDFVIVSFEPWRHVSEEALVTGFYSSLGSALSNLPGSMGIQLDIAALSRNFVSKMDKTGTLESIFTQVPQQLTSLNSFEKVDKLLRDTGKRLIVVLDDVERCNDKSRVLRTLQLGLHLGSDIKNSTTVIISDMQEVMKITDVDQSFLQKFFDDQIVVLPPTKKEMFNITNELMEDLRLDIKIVQDERLDMLTRNIRGIKRILSGLSKDYANIQRNIHPQDLFVMNVIRHAYPAVYSDIMQYRSFYVPFEYDDYADEGFSLYGFSGKKDESDFIKDQAEHLTALVKGLGIEDVNRRRLISVLEELFPATKSRFDGGLKEINDPYTRQHRRERRMGTSRDYLDRYFQLNMSVDRRHVLEDSQAKILDGYFAELDDTKRLQDLETVVNIDDKETEELFYGSLADTLADFNHEDKNRKILARDMLRLYFQNVDHVIRDNRRTLYIILNAINNFIDSSDFEYVFEDLATYMQHPSSGLRLLLTMNPERQNNYYDLKSYAGYSELRKQILSKVDTYYLEQGNDIIEEDQTGDREWRFTLAQWSTSVCYDTPNDFVLSRFKKVNEYLMMITNDSPDKFHELLMHAFRYQNVQNKKYEFNFKITPQPYDAKMFASKARKLLKQEKLNDDIANDLRMFLVAYEEFRSSGQSENKFLVPS